MYEIKIIVNDEVIALTDFPREIITNVVVGILSSLKGVADIKEAKIELKEKNK